MTMTNKKQYILNYLLKVCCKRDYVLLAKFLIKKGADLKNNYNNYFQIACKNGSQKIIKLLLQNDYYKHYTPPEYSSIFDYDFKY